MYVYIYIYIHTFICVHAHVNLYLHINIQYTHVWMVIQVLFPHAETTLSIVWTYCD